MYQFKLDNISFNPENSLILIAGPCVIESKDHCLFMAESLKRISEKNNLPFIFKSSYIKANRSSINSFVGPGLEYGMQILKEIKNRFSIPIISDIHSIEQIDKASQILDILQIPAFLCRQTDLIV